MVVADKDSQSAISLQKYVNLNLEELKDYFSVVFVRNLGEMDREDYDFFIKQDIMPGIDYLMLLSDINGDVLAIEIRIESFKAESYGNLISNVDLDHLYKFASELIENGLYGEAVSFEKDYIDSFPEMKETASGISAEKYLGKYCERFHGVYIYGAGNYGRQCAEILKVLKVPIRAFVETNVKRDIVDDIRVVAVKNLKVKKGEAVIIAMKNSFYVQVIPILTEKGILDYCVYPFWL